MLQLRTFVALTLTLTALNARAESPATPTATPAATPIQPSSAEGELIYDAKVYAMGTKNLLFTYQGRVDMSGPVRVQTNTYKDLNGEIVAVETIKTAKEDTAKLLAYGMDQRQLGTVGTIEVKDGRAYFTFTKDGKTKKDDEKAKDDFIVGSTLGAFLQHHWSEIEAGKRVEAKFAVVDRLEGIHFEYFRDHEETVNGEKRVAIKMKPSSFLVAAIVDPLFFVYSADGKKLREVHGRTQMSTKVDGKWKPLDADTVFEFAPGKP